MSILGDFFKRAFNAKSYVGLIPGGLPSSTKWGSEDFLNANDISLYTNKGIAKRAEKVGEIVFQLKDQRGEVVENNDIVKMLQNPNPRFTGAQFWGLVQSHIDFVGEAYLLIESNREIFEKRKIGALHILMPTKTKPIFNTEGIIEKYEYQTQTGKIEYKAEQVIYLFRPNPKVPLRGISLLQAGVTSIQTEVQISSYHARVIENGGKIEGVFKFQTPRLTKEQITQLKDQYEIEYADARKSGRPLFLGGDAEYMKMGLTPSELSYLETKRMSLEDIVIMTGVPKPLLGSFDDIQYSNADAAIRIFLRETVNPLLRALSSSLDNALFPDELTLTYVDPTPENVKEKIDALKVGHEIGALSTNEKRRVLSKITGEKFEDVPEGDEILVPFNLIPLGEQSVVQDGNTDTGKSKRKGEIEHPLRDADVRKLYGIMQDKKIANRSKVFKKELKNYLEGQRDRIIAHLDPKKTHVFRKENLLEEALQIELEVNIGKETFTPILLGILGEAGKEAMELVGSTYDFNITADIRSWLTNKTEVFLRNITETTMKKLKDEFAESLANSETRPELVERIRETYKDISDARAATIARTEIHGVTQYGTMRGYEQGNMPIKIWVTVGDFAVRESHADQDGEERPINTPFTNGLMYPGDPNGGPEETVNCRCVI